MGFFKSLKRDWDIYRLNRFFRKLNRKLERNPKKALELLYFLRRRYAETEDGFYRRMAHRAEEFLEARQISFQKDCGIGGALRNVRYTFNRRGIMVRDW